MGTKRGFGAIRKLPSGRWQAHYTGPDLRKYNAPQTYDTKEDAEEWLGVRRREISRGDWEVGAGTEKPVTVLFGEYADGWLADRKLKSTTRSQYRSLLRRQIHPTFEKRPIQLITTQDVRTWLRSLGEGTPTLSAHAYSLLRTILNQAVDDDIIVKNPCRIRGAGNADRAHQIRPATLTELTVLTEALPRRYRSMVLIAAWCGLRFGEITELRRSDIDLDTAVIRVLRGVVRVDGRFEVGTPKSAAGIRDVAVPRHLIAPLREHLALDVAAGPTALLFPAAVARNTHMAPATLYRVYYPAREKAGRTDLRFHDLRHTQAVLAAATGASLKELMSRLGHSTPAAAMRYQHVAQDRDRAIANALADIAEQTA